MQFKLIYLKKNLFINIIEDSIYTEYFDTHTVGHKLCSMISTPDDIAKEMATTNQNKKANFFYLL